jgi:hypothetical protein
MGADFTEGRSGGMTMANRDEEEKGFVVKDRRFSAEKQEERVSKPSKEEEKKEETPGASQQEVNLPEIDFANFLLSLSTSVLIQLGEVPDPVSKESAKQLPSAKQTIDLIGMLKDKTKGNLTPDEEKLIEFLLYDLRMRFVKATK